MSNEQLLAREWQLCGEGARNLVLRYQGVQPALVGLVLRLPKAPGARREDASDIEAHAALERELWGHLPGFDTATNDAQRSWLFVQHVLAPLLGEHHACAGRLVTVPAQFMRALAQSLVRPGSCEADAVCEPGAVFAVRHDGCTVGVLLPDHARFHAPPGCAAGWPSFGAPVLAVEIKPKCGFLPQAPSVQPCAKRRVSRYVMHQHLKAAEGRVSKISRYCPLDLFSDDANRVQAALRALLDAPHNNLTVQRDSRLVFGGAGRFGEAVQDDVEPLCAALDGIAPDGMPGGMRVELLLRLLMEALQSHGVLRRLLTAQQLDEHDVEGAYQARKPDGTHLQCRMCYHEHVYDSACRSHDAAQRARTAMHAMPRSRALAVLRDFMTAQTAKDCAIMVTLQLLPDSGHAFSSEGASIIHDAVTGLSFRCKAAFLDLDLKPVAKMRSYVALDRRVLAHYERQVCAAVVGGL